MTEQAALMKEIETLPPRYVAEVLDFVSYLKQKPEPTSEAAALKAAGFCPFCAKYTDPETGELRLNAETIAAIKEGDAMERGEIPANRYHSVDEIWKELEL